jgi:DNA-binding NarL/FixJ family response regulator
MMGDRPIRVILVDDHTLFRDGLRRLLVADGRFEVVGEAASGEDFLALWPTLETDVVFMDIDMPVMNGIEATYRVLAIDPEAKIIALSMHGEQEYYFAMVESGARGFLLKNSSFNEVATAAMIVTEGGTYFSQELLSQLVCSLRHFDVLPHVEALSEREAEILPLICKGFSNQQIGDQLFISKRTVDKHRANILDKTGCKNTASLVVYAIKNNLIEI